MAVTAKSVFKPENSVIAGIATVALVAAVYQLDVGPISTVHATDAGDINVKASVKKAGYTSLVAVAGLSLITRDPNVFILGMAAIAVFHAHSRHATLASPTTGQMSIQPPALQDFQPAQNVVPIAQQGSMVAYG